MTYRSMRRKCAGFSSSSLTAPMAGLMSLAMTDAYVPQVRGLSRGLQMPFIQWSSYSATVGGLT